MSENFNDDLRLWERQPGESEKAFGWFKSFRDLPPLDRTVAEVYRKREGKLGKTAPSWIYELSQKWRWRSRAAAFDSYMDRLQYEAEVNERVKARRLRRAVLLSAMRNAGDALPSIDLTKSSAGELARLLDITARNLREEYADQPENRQTVTLVNGGSTKHVELAQRAESLSDAELVAEYRRLTATAPSRALADDGDDD